MEVFLMKLEERGRAKYRPLKKYDPAKVRELLLKKIIEEQQLSEQINNSLFIEPTNYKESKMNVVSLFSGCGGLDLGFEIAGLDTLYGPNFTNELVSAKDEFEKYRSNSIFHTIYTIDMFKEANQSYRKNFPSFIVQNESDIRKVSDFPISDIVLGGFPCPGFSEAGPRLIDDPRNFLYIHFIRCLVQTKPAFFIAENVKGMMTLGKGEVLRQIHQDFELAGYRVKHKLVNAKDYGVPQNRERVFLVGVREDIPFEYQFPDATHGPSSDLLPYLTLRDAISDLEDCPGEWYQGSFSSMYLSRNRKKNWDDQSFTIQASGRQAPLHPSGPSMKKLGPDSWELPGGEAAHRRLSIKEIARIQTFPDWFSFSDGNSKSISLNGRLNKVYQQIGNAVPVELARAIARPIAEYSTNHLGELQKKRSFERQLELFN
jgi:DNA (cytosine-5)-methyltransferase 1